MPHRLVSLPTFTCIDDGDEVNLWPECKARNYRDANTEGRTRAEELVQVVRRTESVVLLTHVIEAIAKKGDFGGLEIGFFHALSLEILNPEKVIEFVATPPERQFAIGRKKGHLSVVKSDALPADQLAAAVA